MKCCRAVLGIRSAGSGLQMSKASLVIFTELDFEPGKLMQAESRAHRRGATKDVLILYLLVRTETIVFPSEMFFFLRW